VAQGSSLRRRKPALLCSEQAAATSKLFAIRVGPQRGGVVRQTGAGLATVGRCFASPGATRSTIYG